MEQSTNSILLFADMEAKEYSNAWSYQNAKAVITTRQNVTMGLKKGNTVLLHHTMVRCSFFLARSCLGQVPGGAPFSQRSDLATACTSRMQIKN